MEVQPNSAVERGGRATVSRSAPSDATEVKLSAARPLLVPIAPTDPDYARVKRVIDVVLSCIALVALAPVFLLIALGILLKSGRPVIYHQPRLGLGGRPFTLYKFRTMAPEADGILREARGRQISAHPHDPIVKLPEESELITPLGHFLRTSSLDELPQFVNVLKGQMSIVGPRPPLPEEAAVYTPHDAKRLSVIPGITCLWQVSGRSDIPFSEWVELDLEYIRRRSNLLDWELIIKTIPAVLTRRGAR